MGEIKAEGESIKTELGKEIRDGDEETRRYMRVLHEEVLARIATIQEGRPRRSVNQRPHCRKAPWPAAPGLSRPFSLLGLHKNLDQQSAVAANRARWDDVPPDERRTAETEARR